MDRQETFDLDALDGRVVEDVPADQQPLTRGTTTDTSNTAATDGGNPFTTPAAAKEPLAGTRPAPIVSAPFTDHDAYHRPVAVVAGTRRHPRIAFIVHEAHEETLCRRIRKIPGLRYRSTTVYQHPVHGQITGAWTTDVIPDMNLLRECILDIFTGTSGTDLEGIADVSSLATPLVTRGDTTGTVDLWPRLLGYDKTLQLAPAGAAWVRGQGHWTLPGTSLIGLDGNPRPGLLVDDRVLYRDAYKALEDGRVDPDAAATMARVGSALDPIDVVSDFDELVSRAGDVPDWFGRELRPYQRTAAVAMVAGLRLLADEPGTGKTVMALAAAAITGVQRVLIAAPGIAITHWMRETTHTHLLEHMGDGAEMISIVAGRKQKPLPERGVVVVTPSLLRSREQLKDEVVAWTPDLLIYDEAHSSMNWHSKTSTTMREVSRACETAYALTGTPMFKEFDQLAPLLEICGLLDPVFGGYSAFMETYMTKNRFNAWVSKKSMVGPLKDLLDQYCWVRRTKAQVQSDMPPKMRTARIVDVKPSTLVEAHKKVMEKISTWVEERMGELERPPSSREIEQWAKNNIGLSSPLREAAGLAKVPAASEHVVDWVTSTGLADDGTWARPLIVWAHHIPVQDALEDALDKASIPFAAIRGGMSASQIGQIADEFQAGTWPILLASIRAASTGITLTRASDALFVETDWTNAIVSQAESREHRYGQSVPVQIETMIAPGTLDPVLQGILRENARLLLATTPTADVEVAVLDEGDEIPALTPELAGITESWQIVRALVEEYLRRR